MGINFELEQLSNDQDKYRLRNNGVPVSYATFLESLAQSDEFRQIFIETLNGSRFETFRIETPPVSDTLKENAFEFILIDSPHLKAIKPDYYSFAEHFERAKGQSFAKFLNLGGTSTLIAPVPLESEPKYRYSSI